MEGGGIVMYVPCVEKRERGIIDCGVGVVARLFGAERGC